MFCTGHAWTSLSENLASQHIQFLLNWCSMTKLFSEKDFKNSLLTQLVAEPAAR
jgi:hypothetical protein